MMGSERKVGVARAMPTTVARFSLISRVSPTLRGTGGCPRTWRASRLMALFSSTMTASGRRRSPSLPESTCPGPPIRVASSRPRIMAPASSPSASRTVWLPLCRGTAHSTPWTPRTR